MTGRKILWGVILEVGVRGHLSSFCIHAGKPEGMCYLVSLNNRLLALVQRLGKSSFYMGSIYYMSSICPALPLSGRELCKNYIPGDKKD